MGNLLQKLKEIRSSRFSTKLIHDDKLRYSISLTADTIFLVRKDDHIIKVRAEDLEIGMVLINGEKVYS